MGITGITIRVIGVTNIPTNEVSGNFEPQGEGLSKTGTVPRSCRCEA